MKNTRALSRPQIARLRTRLREVAAELGSEAKAARAVGLSQQMVNKIINGDAGGLYVAERLAQYDRIPLEAILHGMPPSLRDVLRANPDRWSKSAIAAVCKQFEASAEDIQWEQMLDAVEKAIAPILNRKKK